MRIYLSLLLLAAGGLVALIAIDHEGFGPWWAVVALGLLAAFGERRGVPLTANVAISGSMLPTLFAAVVFGPGVGLLVGAVSMLCDIGPSRMRWAVYTCTSAVTGGAAGLVAAYLSSLSTSSLASTALAVAGGVVAAELLNLVFCSITLTLRATASVGSMLTAVVPVMPASGAVYASIVGPLALLYVGVSPWAVALFVPPALAAQRLFSMYRHQRELAEGLTSANSQLKRASLEFAASLVSALDARDEYTAGHSAAVAIYARDIATEMNLPLSLQQQAHLAGLLHDIGKIGVPPGILEKPGRLTDAERETMEEHSVIGERILGCVGQYSDIATVVRSHHERFDGGGYPDSIEGSQIPLLSRIIGVADAYNAMTSNRPYRSALDPAAAQAKLVEASGTQFDPDIVRAFIQVLRNHDSSYSQANTVDFALESKQHPQLLRVAA